MSGQQVIAGPATRETGPCTTALPPSPRTAHPGRHTVTNTQRSRISFLSLVVMGTLCVPFLAYSAGAGVEPAEPTSSLVNAPPPIILVALGLLMVAAAVGRRHRKNAAQGA